MTHFVSKLHIVSLRGLLNIIGLVLLASCPLFTYQSMCAEAKPSTPPPPAMPRQFDEATINGLLAAIDLDQNATILKFGFFLRRNREGLTPARGYELLCSAIGKEQVGSKRWFILQDIRSVAAFRTAGVNASEGIQALEEMIAQAPQARVAGADRVLYLSLVEFVSSISGKLRDLGLQSHPRTRELLAKSWSVYIDLLNQPQVPFVHPRWVEAIEISKAQEALKTPVDETLKSEKAPRSFYVIFPAAAVLFDLKASSRALKLMQEAKSLLPFKDSAAVDLFYKTWVKWLKDLDRLSDAASIQKEYVKSTGRGWDGLAVQLWRLGDDKGWAEVKSSLLQPQAKGEDIRAVAYALTGAFPPDHYRSGEAQQEAVTLLNSYLTAGPQRESAEEMMTRLLLGRIHLSLREDEKAIKVMTVDDGLIPPESSKARIHYDQMQQLISRIKNKGITKTTQSAIPKQ